MLDFVESDYLEKVKLVCGIVLQGKTMPGSTKVKAKMEVDRYLKYDQRIGRNATGIVNSGDEAAEL